MADKIAVVGDRDSVLAFKAIGLDVFSAETYFEIKNTIDNLAREYAVIFITEQVAETAADVVNKYKSKSFPAIIPIPGNAGSTGFGIKGVKSDVEKAIGADILFRE